MAFNLFGGSPGFFDFRPQHSLGGTGRPSLDDLLDPYYAPEYPEEPDPLSRGRQLGKDEKRQLTMQMLANIAQAMSGANGELGGRLAGVASANIGAEQGAVDFANERTQRDYQRKTQEAERRAGEQGRRAKLDQDRGEIESMLAVGDKAIEAAGGADADPTFASKVYGLMRTKNASALNAALDEGAHRRLMRDKYGLDPEDPMALEAYKQRQEELQATHRGEETAAREQKTHATNRLFDIAHPTRDATPPRDRMWFDPTSGQIINLDTGEAGAPLGGYTPRPRSGQMFDDVEQEAMDVADRQQQAYDKDPMRPKYQNRNPRMRGYTNDPRQLGKDVPFDWEGAYRAAERTRRSIANQKKAQADLSTGGRGDAPKTSPQAKGVQSPKGAPVGMGGAAKTKQPATAGLTEPEQQRIADEASRRWSKMPPLEKARWKGLQEYIQAAMRKAQAAQAGR